MPNAFSESEQIKKKYILGAIIGDVIGSVFEWNNIKTTKFPLFCEKTQFTDDSVLTVATMDGILNKVDNTKIYQRYGRKFPNAGFGGFFADWIYDEYPEPYDSWGAMVRQCGLVLLVGLTIPLKMYYVNRNGVQV